MNKIKKDSRLILGIDTGGTYTDAALCREDPAGLQLIDSAKARTTKENLTIGIRNAVAGLDPKLLPQISRVSLSTTLATNACVEDMGGEVQLVLITADAPMERQAYLDYGLPGVEEIVFLPQKMNAQGVVQERLSREEIRDYLKPVCRPGVCAAISGLFSTRNPELEREAAEIAAELGAKTICGCDVAPGQLNFLRRGATALLNGRLQPLIRDFLQSVQKAMREFGLDVPIDIVRSDGSLMNHAFALEYPVETLLCGPAASVAGVMQLLRRQSVEGSYLIADIGGTTTDLSLVREHQAVRTEEGVNIGSYRTSVQSVFVETLGLGGDTRLYADRTGQLMLDTNRAIPLCVLAAEYPQVKSELKQMQEDPYTPVYIYEYRVLARKPSGEEWNALSEMEQKLCIALEKGPLNVSACAHIIGRDRYVFQSDHLEKMGLVRKAALTLTDILHLEGSFTSYDAEASRIGAQIFADFLKTDVEEICRRGRELAVFRLYRAIVRMCLEQTALKGSVQNPNSRMKKAHQQNNDAGIDHILETAFFGGTLVQSLFHLPIPLVGVGAAAQAFVPDAAKYLSTECILPSAAPVANAVGAAASAVRAEVSLEIRADREEAKPRYQILGCGDDRLFADYEEAVREAGRLASGSVTELARARGILGALKITVSDRRNVLETDSVYGKQTFDFGGMVTAIAEAESSDVLRGV